MKDEFPLDEKIINEFYSNKTERKIAAIPPKEAYLYFPKGVSIAEIDEKNPIKTLRRVFEGNVEYTSFEKEKIKGFLIYINENNRTCKEQEKIILPNDWNDSQTLKMLLSHSYDNKITLTNTLVYLEWRRTYLPIQPSDNIIRILNIGFIYSHGRDSRFRPLIVLKVRDFKRNYEKFAYEDWVRSIIYLLEYVVSSLLIKGQIENWNILVDCEDASLFSLPSEFKKILLILQNNYKCRLYKLYIMSIPFILKAIWVLVKQVLDSVVQKKIQMVDPGSKELFAIINRSQVEKRFGGLAENLTNHYFPHTVPSNEYFLSGDDPKELLITEEQYRTKVENDEKIQVSPYFIPTPAANFIYENDLKDKANQSDMTEDSKTSIFIITLGEIKDKMSRFNCSETKYMFADIDETETEFDSKIENEFDNDVSDRNCKIIYKSS